MAMRPAIGYTQVPISGYPKRKARWDGQPARCPKKGELYLSGAIVVAYEAKVDMNTHYFIATPV